MATDRRNLKIAWVVLVLCATAGVGVFLAIFSVSEASSNRSRTLRTTESLTAESKATPAAVAAAGNGGMDTSYTVTMSPMGTVRFPHVPLRIITGDANYNDLAVAVGVGDRVIAGQQVKNYYDGFYAQLPGVKFDAEKIQSLSTSATGGGTGAAGFDKELLYTLKADVHHIDSFQMISGGKWTQADIDEITKNVGPFFANRYSRDNSYPGKEPYEYYNVWELGDKIAQVYRKADRIAKLKAIGDALVQKIQAKLPPLEKRPLVALIHYGTGRITTYSMLRGGFGQAQYAAVGARDAFEGKNIASYGDTGGRGTALDLEGLLAINPDVIIMPFAFGGTGNAAFQSLVKLKDDPLGQRLTALKNNTVYPGGTALQGPVFYIFQIEMAAKQIYPELFGRFREDQKYPPEECLFDREAVAKILRGELDTPEH